MLANVELVRSVHGLLIQVQQRACGYPMRWSSMEYWAFAVGAMWHGASLNLSRLWLTIAATIAMAIGIIRLARRRLVGLGASLVLLAWMAAYYHWFVRDPWSGELGQTWVQLKLCQWAFPLVVSVQGAGIGWLLLRMPRSAFVIPVGLLALLGLTFKHHLQAAVDADSGGRQLLQCNRPFEAIAHLRQLPAFTPGRPVRVIHDDGPVWPHSLIHYLLGTQCCIIPEANTATSKIGYMPSQDYVMLGRPAFQDPLEWLPCGLCRVDGSQPFIIAAIAEKSNDQTQGGVRLSAWSPHRGATTLILTVESPCASDLPMPCLEITDSSGLALAANLHNSKSVQIRIPLEAGINRLRLRWLGPYCRLTFAEIKQQSPNEGNGETSTSLPHD
jgi:hypothetical protein